MNVHVKNSVGRAKLRNLTTKLEMTLKDIADKIGYTRVQVSGAANGNPVGNKLIRLLEQLSEGDISVADWSAEYDGDAGTIPLFERRGPRPGTKRKQQQPSIIVVSPDEEDEPSAPNAIDHALSRVDALLKKIDDDPDDDPPSSPTSAPPSSERPKGSAR